MYNMFKNIHLLEGDVLELATIGERIKLLRTTANLSQEEFGKQFGLVKSTVSLYENGRSTPDDETKKKICQHYHISMDWLYGLSSIAHIGDEKTGAFAFDFSFSERFELLLENAHISKDSFATKLGLSPSQIELFENGCADLNMLIAASDYFDVSLDYLLCRTSVSRISELDEKFLSAFQKLDEDNKDIIIGDIKKYLKEQRVENSTSVPYKQAK